MDSAKLQTMSNDYNKITLKYTIYIIDEVSKYTRNYDLHVINIKNSVPKCRLIVEFRWKWVDLST